MVRLSIAYIVSLVVFLGVDIVWLTLIARDFYRDQMGALLSPKPLLIPALAFYLLFITGLVIFGISPALKEGSWRMALVQSALFGLFAYATYDLTNLAVVKDWPAMLSYVDLAWGTALAGLAGLCGYLAASALG